jgi:hypothetical protein
LHARPSQPQNHDFERLASTCPGAHAGHPAHPHLGATDRGIPPGALGHPVVGRPPPKRNFEFQTKL